MEDIGPKIAADIFMELFRSALKGAQWSSSRIVAHAKASDLLGRSATKYKSGMLERHGSMRILGMSKPVPLRDIYTRVNVLFGVSSRRHEDLVSLNEEFESSLRKEFSDIGQRRYGKIQKTEFGITVINELNRIILLGKPGSGKTTFMKFIVLLGISEGLMKSPLPIFVSLNQVSISGKGVLASICHEFEVCGINEPSLFVQNLLENGQCIILLDGLDEVVEARRDDVVREIIDISDQYKGNKFVITCRVAGYNYWFEKFTDVEMADFNDQQAKSFITSWFVGDDLKAALCWNIISSRPPLKELAATPLLLTMMCLAYDENMNLSANRAELYRDASEALLKRWDTSRSIRRDEIYRQLTPKRKEDLLSFIAAVCFWKGEFFFSRARCEKLIGDYITNLSEASKASIDDDSHAILEAVAAQHGIIVERAKNIFSFSHLTFQEYFTSKYLVSKGDDLRARLVRDHLTDPQWREVFVLTASLLPEADGFILLILEQMEKLGFSGRYIFQLRSILRRANLEASKIGLDSSNEERLRTSFQFQAPVRVLDADLAPTVEVVQKFIEDSRQSLLLSLSGRILSATRTHCQELIKTFPNAIVRKKEGMSALEALVAMGSSHMKYVEAATEKDKASEDFALFCLKSGNRAGIYTEDVRNCRQCKAIKNAPGIRERNFAHEK